VLGFQKRWLEFLWRDGGWDKGLPLHEPIVSEKSGDPSHVIDMGAHDAMSTTWSTHVMDLSYGDAGLALYPYKLPCVSNPHSILR
jgi:hypothetical protein